MAQGDHAGARAVEEEVLTVRRRVQGMEHPDTLSKMGNLAQALRAQGDHAGARRIHEEVLAVRRRVLRADIPTVDQHEQFGEVLGDQGDQAAHDNRRRGAAPSPVASGRSTARLTIESTTDRRPRLRASRRDPKPIRYENPLACQSLHLEIGIKKCHHLIRL